VVTTTIEATSLWHRTFWWVDNRRKGTRKAKVLSGYRSREQKQSCVTRTAAR